MEKKNSDMGHICLTLKKDSTVKVGEDVEIYVKQVGGAGIGNAVRIVVTAPIEKKIYRVKKDARTGDV
jgi:sRNA-binding carbon storage regulator CsrA